MQSATNAALSEESIRVRAYLLWEVDGRQHGRDDHYWREAVKQLQMESVQPSPVTPSKASATAKVKKAPAPEKRGKNEVVKALRAAAVKKSNPADSDEAKTTRRKKPSTKAAAKETGERTESERPAKASSADKRKRKLEASDSAAAVQAQRSPKLALDDAQSSAQ
jgi:hypothetical protein